MILIADDHVDTALFLKRLLERHGFTAQVVHDGEQVLSSLRAARPALIILDAMMPKHDGFSVLRHMIANATWRTIPVIMYSAHFESEREQQALQLGAKAFLVKGAVDVAHIVAAVRRFAA